jgi:hypothetical protein
MRPPSFQSTFEIDRVRIVVAQTVAPIDRALSRAGPATAAVRERVRDAVAGSLLLRHRVVLSMTEW